MWTVCCEEKGEEEYSASKKWKNEKRKRKNVSIECDIRYIVRDVAIISVAITVIVHNYNNYIKANKRGLISFFSNREEVLMYRYKNQRGEIGLCHFGIENFEV